MKHREEKDWKKGRVWMIYGTIPCSLIWMLLDSQKVRNEKVQKYLRNNLKNYKMIISQFWDAQWSANRINIKYTQIVIVIISNLFILKIIEIIFPFYKWGSWRPEYWFAHSPWFVYQVLVVRGLPFLSWTQPHAFLGCWLVDHSCILIWYPWTPEIKNV